MTGTITAFDQPISEGSAQTVRAQSPDVLSVTISKTCDRPMTTAVVGQRGFEVHALIDDKLAVFNTTTAYDVGKRLYELAYQLKKNEWLVVRINGESRGLTFDQGKSLATGLIRKADAADDFQRLHNLRIK